MAAEQMVFHIVIEILAIFISIYFLYISRLFKGWKKYALRIIAIGVIVIDLYALLGWAGIVDFLPKTWFHVITEAMALPAGVILIYPGTEKIKDIYARSTLIGMGIANIVVDGLLVLTWF